MQDKGAHRSAKREGGLSIPNSANTTHIRRQLIIDPGDLARAVRATNYSIRSAAIGLIRLARNAGTAQAASATVHSSTVAAANDVMSCAVTSNSRLPSSRVVTNAA